MLERLHVPEGKNPEEIRKEFDNELGVTAWATPGRPINPEKETDRSAPSWWTGEEDASQSFLSSMGVILPDG
jgi:hypothetical protein